MHRDARFSGSFLTRITIERPTGVFKHVTVTKYKSGQARPYGDDVTSGTIESTVPMDEHNAVAYGSKHICSFTQRRGEETDWAGHTMDIRSEDDGRKWLYEVVQVYLD